MNERDLILPCKEKKQQKIKLDSTVLWHVHFRKNSKASENLVDVAKIEPHDEKTYFGGFWPGKTQTGLLSYRG